MHVKSTAICCSSTDLAATPLSPSPSSVLATKIDEDQRAARAADKQNIHQQRGDWAGPI